MLQGRNDVLFLDAAHFLDTELAHQKRILAIALDDTAPALVARDLENRRIDIGVAERARLAARHATDFAHEVAVKRARDAELRRKTGRLPMQQAADALVGHVRRHPETRLLDEEPLDVVQRPCVQRIRQRVFRLFEIVRPTRVAVHLLVDVADAVLPKRRRPFFRRQLVLQHPRKSVERDHLRRLLVDVHPRHQVGHALFAIERGILVRVLHAILVKIDPSLVVDGRGWLFADEHRGRGSCRQRRAQCNESQRQHAGDHCRRLCCRSAKNKSECVHAVARADLSAHPKRPHRFHLSATRTLTEV